MKKIKTSKTNKVNGVSRENKVAAKNKNPVLKDKDGITYISPAKSSIAGPAKENKESYTVLRDTREQQGWTFEEGKFCNGTIPRALKTGDYTILGLENILCVERKKSVAEIAGNILEKRFERELERMEAFPYAFIICEFTLADVMNWPPFYLKNKVKTTKFFIIRRLNEIQIKYKVKIIFGGVHAKELLVDLFKRVVEAENEKRIS